MLGFGISLLITMSTLICVNFAVELVTGVKFNINKLVLLLFAVGMFFVLLGM